MEEKIFDGLTYLISYPEGFQADKKYPLVILLHGAGSRGETTKDLRAHGCLKRFLMRQVLRWLIPTSMFIRKNEKRQPAKKRVVFLRIICSLPGCPGWQYETGNPEIIKHARPIRSMICRIGRSFWILHNV